MSRRLSAGGIVGLVALGLVLAGCGSSKRGEAPPIDLPVLETPADPGPATVSGPVSGPESGPVALVPGTLPIDADGDGANDAQPPAEQSGLRLSPELGRLIAFWAVERFLIDRHHEIVAAPSLQAEVVAKAPVDECFKGVGVPAGEPVAGVCSEGIARRNQSYLWGLAAAGDALFWGTMSNTPCWFGSGLGEIGAALSNESMVCELNRSTSGTGDWRAPHVYRRLADGTVQDLAELAQPKAAQLQAVLANTQGIRSALFVEAQNLVLLAGPARMDPSLVPPQVPPDLAPWMTLGVNFLGFDAATGEFLGAQFLPQYSDIRSWARVEGARGADYYAGVSSTASQDAQGNLLGGFVLRLRGVVPDDPATRVDEFAVLLEPVGRFDTEAANLAVYRGRLFVSTWPQLLTFPAPADAKLFASPVLPPEGLSSASLTAWTQLWAMSDYDPDFNVSRTALAGPLAEHDGALFFSTMLAPFTAALYTLQQQGGLDLENPDVDGILTTLLGTHRSPALFRLTYDENDTPRIRLVQGERFLPVFDPAAGRYTIAYDALHESPMRQTPSSGASGFGNFFNAYIWSLRAHRGELFIGTFDWSQVARVGLLGVLGIPEFELPRALGVLGQVSTRFPQEGADLYRLDGYGEIVAESLGGLGNTTNYGVRNIVPIGDDLYLGTANPMNLNPRGGFELIRLREPAILRR